MGRQGSAKRAAGFALSVVALVLSLTAGGASAHKAGYSSSILLQPKLLSDAVIEYSGKVNSEAKLCRAGRAVDLFVGGSFLTTVSTDAAGNWLLTGSAPPRGTDVTAVIDHRVKRKGRHRHRCAPDAITKKAQ
jgi:hypothetical protein